MALAAEALQLSPNQEFADNEELTLSRLQRFGGQVSVEAVQAEHDITTQLAELVDGSMRTEFELSFDGQDLYGPDGRSLIKTAANALEDIRAKVKKDPSLWFEVGRRSTELDEINQLVDMFKTGRANTLFVTSEFPKALKGATKDKIGYNVERQQAMKRVITRLPDGKIMLYSQTLDGSNERGLAAIHREYGFNLDPNQPALEQRQEMNLDAQQQATFMDRGVTVYDNEMSSQYGGEWHAGRSPIDRRNTYDFVCQQHDLIKECLDLSLSGQLSEEIMYNIAAEVNDRFKKSKTAQNIHFEMPPNNIAMIANSREMLYREMQRSGNAARARGQTFSACGITLSSTEDLMENAGYGLDNSSISSDRYGSRTFQCRNGHTNTRPHNSLIDKCQACGVSVKC